MKTALVVRGPLLVARGYPAPPSSSEEAGRELQISLEYLCDSQAVYALP
jgi:hypothetical protein